MSARSAALSSRTRHGSFRSIENVRENASIAYSPASSRRNSMRSPTGLGRPDPGTHLNLQCHHRSHSISATIWARCVRLVHSPRKSQWFLAARNRQLHHPQRSSCNRQRCPSTGADSRTTITSNPVISNQFTSVQPGWLATSSLAASRTAPDAGPELESGLCPGVSLQRNLATVSGFETFGDNQFATPITLFPVLTQPGEISASL